MTITVVNIVAGPYVATGAAQSLAFAFKVFTPSEVEVIYGADRTAVDPALYTVTINKAADGQVMEGGAIELSSDAVDPGVLLLVVAKPAKDQALVFSDTASRLRNLNEGLDRATLRVLRATYDGALEGAGQELIALAELAGREAGTAAAADVAEGTAKKAANLSDLENPLIARNNLRISEYSTRAVAVSQSVVSSVAYIRTAGYAASGDGGGALYKRVSSAPAHEAKFQTADGAWWEMANKHVHPEMFGAKGDGVTDDSWPVAQAVGFASTIEFLAKNYVCTVNAWRAVRIVGQGRHYTTLTCPAATGVAVNLAASPYYLRGVTVTRSVVATAGLGIDTVANGYGTIEDVISSEHWDGIQFNATANAIGERVFARNNYNNGFVFVTSGTSESCQWKITNAVSEMNNGWGVSAYAIPVAGPDQTGPVLANVGTYKNGAGGWVWSGGSGTAWNDVNALHCYSSFDNGPGMYFTNPGANNQFVDTFVEFATTVAGGRNLAIAAKNNASGIRIEGGARNDSALIFVGLVSIQNAIAGLVNTGASTLKTLQIQGARTVDNGRASGSDRYGVYLASATTRTVITNLSSQGQLFTTQQYGVAVSSSAIAGKTSVIGAAMNGNSTGPTNTATTDYAAWLGVLS